ncbi:MAG TPA: lipopolysaccharide biosynthesis protein [Vicinamibacterales bacterium]|nr:lipopolysaccharide biosynthesis protein [Vicinamibacterales bacterium]
MLARIKTLFGNLAIYGLGDVATSIVSLLLLPVFTSYLTPADYGVITMLLTVEAVTKVLFRWGVDTAFMRLYYDCADPQARQRLASTIFFFLLAVNGALLGIALLSLDVLAPLLLGEGGDDPGGSLSLLVGLTLVNTFVTGFYFMPFQVLRIAGQPRQFIALAFARSAGTIVARLLLVISAGMGVFGIVVADLLVTAFFTAVLIKWFAPLIRPVFSRAVIREALAFGLPRVPHSIAHQVIGFADRYLLKAYGTLADVGLYSIGASFGLALKFFLSALELAWTPFFLGVMREPDAARIYSTVSTYVIALLVLLVGGLCAVAPGVVQLFTTEGFQGAAVVIPWIALGVMFQGLYLVGSIGLVITKRTKLYPIATGTAAAVSVLANLLLIPRYGILGAAWANTVSYATLALVTVGFSRRVYPIPYEWNRLLRIALAGGTGYVAAVSTVPSGIHALARIGASGVIMVAVYGLVLYVGGFFHAGELKQLREVRERVLRRKAVTTFDPGASQVEMAGEIVATASEPPADPAGYEAAEQPAPPVSPDFRSPRR